MTTISRREFLKQAMALGLSASSAAALLEACGGTQSAGGKVTVNLYHTIPTATETFWKQTLLPSFEKQYPNMNLITYQLGVENPQVIRTKIKAGGDTAPDMAWLDSGETGAYVQANLLPDVDGWLNSHPTIKQDIFPSLIALSSYQGKVRSFPWMTNNTAMQINLDAFEKAGVPIPSQDPMKTWTWDQFAEACKLISQKTNMKGFLMNNGGPLWDTWLFHAWLGANGGWNFPDLVKFNKFKFTVVPYPIKTQPAANTGGDQLFVFNNSPQKVAYEYDYAQYMLTDNFQVAFNIESGNLPVTTSATMSAAYQAHLKQYPFLYGWVNGVPYGVALSSLPQAGGTQTAFGQKAWDPIILQGANVQQALATAAAAVTALKQ